MTESQAPLFPGDEPPPTEDLSHLSPDRRRTLRQAQSIANGIHPLTGGPVHLLADLHPSSGDPKNLPYRCGSCIWRVLFPYHNKSYPKCTQPGAHLSHSAASDVRAWWPACRAYSPGDPSLSPDAARFIPEEAAR